MANRAQVHIFGRGRATLQTSDGEVVTSCAPRATLDGVAVRRCPGGGQDYAVWIRGGGLRLHGCDITSASWACLAITDGSNPVVSNCRIHDAQAGVGVGVGGEGTKGLLVDCEIWENAQAGVRLWDGGDPVLIGNTIRDHAGKEGYGVLVLASARGKGTIGRANRFFRNEKGDVVRV